jgi:2,4-dienoyl-CoA reductase-like NADH-dependent reductase (Old Yellow Enzyme family)
MQPTLIQSQTAGGARLAQPLVLSSGLVLRNRLAKSATSECLAGRDDEPTPAHARLYARFAQGGAGLLITGNVMIDRRALERPGNVVIEDERHLPALEHWAQAASAAGSAILMQLNHPGRQSNRMLTQQPVAPSAGPAVAALGAFAAPRALLAAEIEALIGRFARAARVAQLAGFAGVQLHAAHGYLISQFLAPRTNQRRDEWGGSLDNRARFLRRSVAAIRAATAPGFTLAVKLNSADFQRGGFEPHDALEVVRMLTDDGVDLLEVSGGTYEAPVTFGYVKESTRSREAYFLDFVRQVRPATPVTLMTTGGFRSGAAMEEALQSSGLDLVGMARPILLEPDLPRRLLAGQASVSKLRPLQLRPLPLRGAAEFAFFDAQLRRMAAGLEPNPALPIIPTLLRGVVADFLRAKRRRAAGDVGAS